MITLLSRSNFTMTSVNELDCHQTSIFKMPQLCYQDKHKPTTIAIKATPPLTTSVSKCVYFLKVLNSNAWTWQSGRQLTSMTLFPPTPPWPSKNASVNCALNWRPFNKVWIPPIMALYTLETILFVLANVIQHLPTVSAICTLTL